MTRRNTDHPFRTTTTEGSSSTSPIPAGLIGEPATPPFLIAGIITLAAGITLFGWPALRIAIISVAATLLTEVVLGRLTRRRWNRHRNHILLMGILFACTLPANVMWYVPVLGAISMVFISHLLLGGFGNYIWHPVALGRIVVELLFHEQLAPRLWPVTDAGSRVSSASGMGAMALPRTDWIISSSGGNMNSWLPLSPAGVLYEPLPARTVSDPHEAIASLVRDLLPPWQDTLTGQAGGCIGEACALAILLAGLLLMWRGFLRPRMLVVAAVAAVTAAALLPVRIQPVGSTSFAWWCPGTAIWNGLPVGLVYICYQLTIGDLLFVLLILGPAPGSSPITSRGHARFGLVVVVMALFFRIVVGVAAGAYWALLIANTLVPLIDRMTHSPESQTPYPDMPGG